MTGHGGRDDRNDPEGANREGGFADLIGETRPIDRGPARVEPRPRVPPTAKGRSSEDRSQRERGFRWPDPAIRQRAAAPGVNDATLFALGRGEPEPEERIDLHGARKQAARQILGTRLESAARRGLRCVLVIHGRGQRSATGEAVLRDALPGWLSTPPCAPHVLAFAPAPPRLGDDGATLVLLKPTA